jgi:hypothetical protein
MSKIDAAKKLEWICNHADTVATICLALPDSFTARIYSRSLVIATRNFLDYASFLKNDCYKIGSGITRKRRSVIERTISELRKDFESYSTTRNKLAAHFQHVDIVELLERWVDLDSTTVTILNDSIRKVYDLLAEDNKVDEFEELPTRQQVVGAARQFVCFDTADTVDTGLFGASKPHAIVSLPTTPDLMTAQRIISIIDSIQVLGPLSQKVTNPDEMATYATFSLIVIDLCSLVDNIYERNKRDLSELPLLSQWVDLGMAGAIDLKKFRRDRDLENTLREARNKTFAHLDDREELAVLRQRFSDLDSDRIFAYTQELVNAFSDGLARDERTGHLLLHRQKLKHMRRNSTLTIEEKPFRA